MARIFEARLPSFYIHDETAGGKSWQSARNYEGSMTNILAVGLFELPEKGGQLREVISTEENRAVLLQEVGACQYAVSVAIFQNYLQKITSAEPVDIP